MNDSPSPQIFEAANEAETAAVAKRLAASLESPCVIALHGDLGAGKTAFARALIRAMPGVAADEEVPSPTFTLVQIYETDRGALWHFDLYRIEQPIDVLELGWDEAMDDAICLIEWPEKAGAYLPSKRLDIEIAPGKTSEARRITLHRREEPAP